MYQKLSTYMDALSEDMASIPKKRKDLLSAIGNSISRTIKNEGVAKLNFICTHNSRRSHLAQIWCATWAESYGLSSLLSTYSGGTEATAFHPNAVSALKRCGFLIDAEGEVNPNYLVYSNESSKPIRCFSKTYDDPFNPSTGFIAIMTCSDADENCPIVHGATERFALTYEDPKVSDRRIDQNATYDLRCRQIASEIGRLFKEIERTGLS